MTKIELIKAHRTLTGSTLRDAKDAVEAGWTLESHQKSTENQKNKDIEIQELEAQIHMLKSIDKINQETIDNLLHMIRQDTKNTLVSIAIAAVLGAALMFTVMSQIP